MTVHNFIEQLEYSETASDEKFWSAVYVKAFPNMVAHTLCSGDTKSQRMGIDRAIILANGKTLYIDEKKRKKVYNDILLEFESVSTTGAPGWIEKDLMIDYLAYAFMPTQKVYLYPWPFLRRAWIHYKDVWMKEYEVKEAKNEGYITKSLAVPISTINKAVSTAMIIQLEEQS